VTEQTPQTPAVLAAFSGWNDASDAATGVIDHLLESWDHRVVAELDPDDYLDYQSVRPQVEGVGSDRRIAWPTPTVYAATPPHTAGPVLLMRSPEPSFRWRAFTAELLRVVREQGAGQLICLGALLADTPHSRPLAVTASSTSTAIERALDRSTSQYQGPAGITGVVAETAKATGLTVTSLWAEVPHYVAEPPCPKATLALLGALEDVLGHPLPEGELAEWSAAWQRGADELIAADDDLAEYVRMLESEHDEGSPQASGDAIAREFERFLRRRDL